MDFNLDYIELFLIILVLLLLIFAGHSSRAQFNDKGENLRSTKKPGTSTPQFQQTMNEVAKVNDVANILSFMLQIQKEQRLLKADMDKVLAYTVGLEQSLRSIEDATQRFDRVLAGPQSKGALGEQIVAEQLRNLPQEWIRKNVPFRNDTRVEFCVQLPDGRLIPIDSKWAGTNLLDQLGQITDKSGRAKLERAIQNEVWKRGLEVHKYLDDHRTIGFCIVTVPDPVFHLCLDLQPYLVKRNIVLISYSLLVPYILILVKLHLSNAQAIQALQMSNILGSSIIEIEQIQEFIDTKLRRPLDTFKQQQSEYRSQSEGIEGIYQRLKQIQTDLEPMRNSLSDSNNPLSNSEISAIPDELKDRINELRKSLIENKAKYNGHVQNDFNQQPVE